MSDGLMVALCSGLGVAVVSAIKEIVLAATRKKSAADKAVYIILYDRISYLGNAYLRKGWATQEERRTLSAMHEVYHTDYGGNGDFKDLMEDVWALPREQKLQTKIN